MHALGLAWDVQTVPRRIYEEARATRVRRAARRAFSVVEAAPPIGLELAEDVEI